VKPDRVRKDKAAGYQKAAGNADFWPVLPMNYGIGVRLIHRPVIARSKATKQSMSQRAATWIASLRSQ
jgi:hypothetical protein